jgi:histidinol-phosphate aminotransferase
MKPEQFIITNGGVELGSNAKDIYEQLLNKGIIVRYGGTWNLPRHVRVSVGT